jgi:hypothetical protein
VTTRRKSATKKAPSKSSAAPAKAGAALVKAGTAPAKPAAARAGVPRRIKLPDAMRAQGLDEPKIAGKFGGMIERLSGRKPKARPTDKMLLEVLKECGKLLGAYPAARGGDADAIPVEMMHCVARPVRPVDIAAIPPAAQDGSLIENLRANESGCIAEKGERE